jgi:hypothetical protein
MAATAVGLPIEDILGGDIGYLPLSVVPVSAGRTAPQTNVGAPEAEEQAEEQQGKSRPQSDLERHALHVQFARALREVHEAIRGNGGG